MVNQIAARTIELMLRWGFHGEIAARIAVINTILQLMGLTAITVISGYRDPLLQEKLLANWQAGREVYPVGMPAEKPACDSTHSTTMGGYPAATGFDVSGNAASRNTFTILWKIFSGARWGGDFDNPDPNHYDAHMPFVERHPIC